MNGSALIFSMRAPEDENAEREMNNQHWNIWEKKYVVATHRINAAIYPLIL